MIEFEETGPEITEQHIGDVEQALGMALPDDYKSFVLKNNGGIPIEMAIDFATPNQLNKTGDYCDRFFDVSDKPPYGIVYSAKAERNVLPDGVIRFGASPAGNYYLLSLRDDSFGTVLYKDHNIEDQRSFDLGNGQLPESMIKLSDSFSGFLDMLYDPDAE